MGGREPYFDPGGEWWGGLTRERVTEDMGTPASNFEAQMERKMGVGAPVRDGARPGEEGDDPEAVEFDELAEVMQGVGLSAGQAVGAARAAVNFFEKKNRQKDRQVCAGLVGLEAGGMAWMAQEEASDRLVQVLGRAFRARDAALAIGCLCFAFDRAPAGMLSMRDLASKRGVSVQEVCDEVDAFQELLGLPRTKLQKSAAALASYKKSNGAQWKPGRN